MAILQCADIDDMYFVFTHRDDALEDPLCPLSLDESWRVVDFDWGGGALPPLIVSHLAKRPARQNG